MKYILFLFHWSPAFFSFTKRVLKRIADQVKVRTLEPAKDLAQGVLEMPNETQYLNADEYIRRTFSNFIYYLLFVYFSFVIDAPFLFLLLPFYFLCFPLIKFKTCNCILFVKLSSLVFISFSFPLPVSLVHENNGYLLHYHKKYIILGEAWKRALIMNRLREWPYFSNKKNKRNY